MSLITFDWAQIAYTGSPLATPWWAAANVAAGLVIFYCEEPLDPSPALLMLLDIGVLAPILYYTNVWNSQYMPYVLVFNVFHHGLNVTRCD